MWERVTKAPRVHSPSPSTSRPQVISIESHAEAQGTLAQLEAAAAREPETEIAVVPNDQISVEPEVASNELQSQLTTTVWQKQNLQNLPLLSPIRDGKFDYESSGEVVYAIESLHHDPRKRRPIRRHPVNERNSVIRGYIALGLVNHATMTFLLGLLEVNLDALFLGGLMNLLGLNIVWN